MVRSLAEHGLARDSNGFVAVGDLLAHPDYSGVSEAAIRRVALNSVSREGCARFLLIEDSGILKIRPRMGFSCAGIIHEGEDEGGPLSMAAAAAPEEWQYFLNPGDFQVWFWNEATNEHFFQDDLTSGWKRSVNAAGKPLWTQKASGRYFYEPELWHM